MSMKSVHLLVLAVAGLLCVRSALAIYGGFPPPAVAASLPSAGGEVVAARNQEAYVANAALDRVAVISANNSVSYIPVGRTPRFIVSHATGFITSNAGDNTVSVMRSDFTAATVPVGGFGPLVADSTGNGAYLLRGDGVIVSINASTLATAAFDTGLRSPVAHALNRSRNRLYVADASGEVRVFDITAANPAQAMESFRVPGRPAAITAGTDPRFYVLTDASGGTLVEVDLSSNATRGFALPGGPQQPRALVWARNAVIAGFANQLAFFDIATHNITQAPAADVRSLDFDSESGLAFAVAGSNLLVMSTVTMEIVPVPVAQGSTGVEFLYKPCRAYVGGPVVTIVYVPCGDLVVGGVRAQALWWVPEGAESGWGLNISHHGFAGTLFATWFTYDANGQPTWLVMSEGRDFNKNDYQGTLYRTSGPAFNAPTFDPAKVTRTPVGSLEVFVASVNSASIRATVDGVAINKPLARQLFSSPVPFCDAGLSPGSPPNYQDLWWNPTESGWGVNIAHQGDTLFITWFTYGTDGRPTWFVGSDVRKTGNATYAGTLYTTSGPPLTAMPWDPARVARTPVGSVGFTFGDAGNGVMTATVGGATVTKAITREVFASPATMCR